MSTSRLSMRISTGDASCRLLPEIFKHKLVQIAEETMDSLQKIWTEAGYEESERQRLLGEMLTKLQSVCSNEVAAEEQILAHARQEVETLATDVITKHAQLGRTAKLDYVSELTVTDKLTELDKILSVISKEVDERQTLFDKEMQVITAIVQEMAENMPPSNAFDGPAGTPHLSDLRLNLMRDYRRHVETQRQCRRQELETLYRECVSHMQDMCYVEGGSIHSQEQTAFQELDAGIARFGRALQANSSSELPLASFTKQHVQQMSQRVEMLIAEKEYRRSELSKTGEEIARLWSLLRVDRSEREAFTASFRKNLSLETLRKGYGEANRLRQLRKESLGSVLSVLRSDIETLWIEIGMLSAPFASQEASYVHETELCQHEFDQFFVCVEDATEELLDAHETYFASLRQRVEELRPLLLKIHRREVVVQERIELEQLQMNPERLTARGPNAREERKREEAMTNRVKNLEKLTKEIVAAIAACEKDADGPFQYGGERYGDRIARQEERYTELRDALRNARKSGKKDVAGMVAHATAQGNNNHGGLHLSTSCSNLNASASVSASTSTSMRSSTAATPAKIAATPKSASAAFVRHHHSLAMSSAAHDHHHDVENQPMVGNTSTSSTLRSRTASKDLSSRIPTLTNATTTVAKDVPRDKEHDRDSDNTLYTSVTEVKERHSGGSVTVVREIGEC
jgi:hypothetical protein